MRSIGRLLFDFISDRGRREEAAFGDILSRMLEAGLMLPTYVLVWYIPGTYQ